MTNNKVIFEVLPKLQLENYLKRFSFKKPKHYVFAESYNYKTARIQTFHTFVGVAGHLLR